MSRVSYRKKEKFNYDITCISDVAWRVAAVFSAQKQRQKTGQAFEKQDSFPENRYTKKAPIKVNSICLGGSWTINEEESLRHIMIFTAAA